MNKLSNLDRAIILATKAHAGQVDRANQHYIFHLLEVMYNLLGDDLKTVSMLHDIIKYTSVQLIDIEFEFGTIIMDAVDAITQREGEANKDYWKRCAENDLAFKVKQIDLALNQKNLWKIEDGVKCNRLEKKYHEARITLQEHRQFVIHKRNLKDY